MKITRTLMTGSVFALLLLLAFGCQFSREGKTVRKDKEPPEAAAEINSSVVVSYPVDEEVEVQVVFENQQTYSLVQLGLVLLRQQEGDASTSIPSITDPAFFPKYFAMISTGIDDGLVIYEAEAKRFANVTYLRFRKQTVSPEYLTKPIKRSVIQLGGGGYKKSPNSPAED